MGNQDAQARLLLERELNELFTKNLEAIEKTKKSLSEQLEIQLNINKAASGNDKNTRNATDAQQELQQAVQDTNSAIQNNTSAQRDFEVALRDSAAEQDKQKEKMELAANVAGGFADAITGTISGLMGMGKAVGSLIGTIFNLTKAILSVPLDILDWFVQQAKDLPDDVKEATGGGGAANTALKEAMEETRKSFGDLASGPGKAVVDMYHNISSAGKLLAGTGLHLNQIFGSGVEGQAAILKYANEMATSLGVSFMNLAEDMKKNAGYYSLVGKAFNLSAEEMTTLQKRAYNMGQDPKKAVEEFSKTAMQLGKALNVDTKMLGKGMIEMTAAFPAFASKGAKAIGTATAHLHKLGIEVKDLKGMFDKFDSFDSAAESASTLSQTLGVQVDAMKLVQEQDPTKKLELMRNAFRAAGKDISQMTSAERKLALETTGMSEAMFDAAMGEGNKKKLLSETEKAAQAATKAQMDSTKAMKEMAKAIQRLMPSGGGGGGGGAEAPNVRKDFDGFFDAMKKGFLDGVQNAKPVKDVIENIGKSLKLIYKAAYEVGDAFVNNFPGVKSMLEGLKEFFDPNTLAPLITKTKNAFLQFFEDLNNIDPGKAVEKLISRISAVFSGQSAGGLDKIQQGFETFMKAVSGIAAKLVEKMMGMVTDAFIGLTNLIADPSPITNAAGAAEKGAESFFTPIGNAIKKKWPMLKAAMSEFFDKLWEQVIKPLLWKLAPYIAMYFGAQLAMQLGPVLGKELLQKAFKDEWFSKAASWLGPKLSSFANTVTSGMGNAFQRAMPGLSGRLSSLFSGSGGLFTRLSSMVGPGFARFASSIGGHLSTFGSWLSSSMGSLVGKAGTMLVSTGGKALLGAGILSLVVGGIKGGMEAYDAWKQGGDSKKVQHRFWAGFTSALTLGVFDTDEVEDAFFGTKNVAKKLIAADRKIVDEAVKEIHEYTESAAEDVKTRMKDLVKETNVAVDGMNKAIDALFRKKGPGAEVKIQALTDVKNALAKSAADIEAQDKEFDVQRKKAEDMSGEIKKMRESITKEEDSKAAYDLKLDAKRFSSEAIAELQALGKKYGEITGDVTDGVLTIDDDTWQHHNAEFQAILDKYGQTNEQIAKSFDLRKKEAEKTADQALSALDTGKLKEAFSAATEAGVTGEAVVKLQEELRRRFTTEAESQVKEAAKAGETQAQMLERVASERRRYVEDKMNEIDANAQREAQEQAQKTAAAEAAAKEERIQRAKDLPATIKHINESLNALPKLEEDLDKALANFEKKFNLDAFKKKIQTAADKIAEIFPLIEQAFKNAAEKSKAAVSTTSAIKDINITMTEVIGIIERVNRMSKEIPTAVKLNEIYTQIKNLSNFMITLTSDVGPDGQPGLMKVFATQVKAPDLTAAITAMSSLGQLTNTAKNALENVTQYEKLIHKISEIANKPPLDPKGKVHAVAQVIAGLTTAPGGKVEVTHNLPNVKIEIKVDMNAAQVAKAIVHQPVGTSGGHNQYFGTGATKPNVS